MTDALSYGAFRIIRCIQYFAVFREVPAVVTALNSVRRWQGVLERSTPVAAIPIQNADVAFERAEYHQVFAEHLDDLRQVAELLGQYYRLPHAPQVLSAWRAGTDVRDLCVFADIQRPVVGAKGTGYTINHLRARRHLPLMRRISCHFVLPRRLGHGRTSRRKEETRAVHHRVGTVENRTRQRQFVLPVIP